MGQPTSELPQTLELRQNFPNPFNPETTISFGLPEAGQGQLVIYDLMGREIGRLVDGNLGAGWHQVRWDASRLASGTYIYRIQVAGEAQSRVMTLIK
ncbi:MAG: T9SS type A sorting domain-containing protein [Balneolales bacterium]|nr:T9SS type A sorting domain-containing protein [Balneolales bacterium]